MDLFKKIFELIPLLEPYPSWVKALAITWILLTASLIAAVIFAPKRTALAKVVEFEGKVLNKATGDPVRRAKVVLSIPGKENQSLTDTDSEGIFRFSLELESDSISVRFRIEKDGFESYERNTSLSKQQAKLANFELQQAQEIGEKGEKKPTEEKSPNKSDDHNSINNVSKYVINGVVKRLNYSGTITITPVGLFKDSKPLADGSPSGYTFLLCRFTNVGDRPITVGAIMDQSDRWYRLDNPGYGHEPTLTTLVQWQMWFRGRPIDPKSLESNSKPNSLIDKATLEIGETKYGYINSLGSAWPKILTVRVVDVTDTNAGTASIAIEIQN